MVCVKAMSKINLTGSYLYQSVPYLGLHQKCTIWSEQSLGVNTFRNTHSFTSEGQSLGEEKGSSWDTWHISTLLWSSWARLAPDPDCKTHLLPYFWKSIFWELFLRFLAFFNFVNGGVLDCMSSFGKKSWLQRPGSQVQVGDEWCRNSKNGEHIILGSLLHPLYFSQ